MSNTAAIRLEGVSFSYGPTPVLSDVSFTVQRGEFASIVGPNGGGKTTLLKLLLGLEKPKSGSISVLGATPTQARRRIGYMPQHLRFDPLFPVSVRDVVLMGRLAPGRFWYSREDKRLAAEALAQVGLEDRQDLSFADLSGGQRQRALIARALAVQPEILLLDEPTAMVDVAAADNLVTRLREINKRCTIVVVSHDLGFVSQIVDSVVCVNRTVAHHPTSSLTGDTVKELYGTDVRMIHHDHRCTEHGHVHEDGGEPHTHG